MKTGLKISLILAGYLAAFAGACLSVWINDHFLLPPDVRDSGMAAGGDMILFIGVIVFLSLFPTALALFFLRTHRPFWALFSKACLVLAVTGPIWLVMDLIFGPGRNPNMSMFWMMAGFVGMLRLTGSVILAMGEAAFALIAPNPKARWTLLIAAALEGLTGLITFGSLFLFHRFP